MTQQLSPSSKYFTQIATKLLLTKKARSGAGNLNARGANDAKVANAFHISFCVSGAYSVFSVKSCLIPACPGYELRRWHVISRRNDEKSLRTMLASRLCRDFSAFGYEMTLWDVKCVTPIFLLSQAGYQRVKPVPCHSKVKNEQKPGSRLSRAPSPPPSPFLGRGTAPAPPTPLRTEWYRR